MVKIDNIYFDITENDYQLFYDTIEKCYKEREKIRIIIDIRDKNISFEAFMKIKKVFDELGVEKLEETYVIAKDGFKIKLINGFINLIPTKRDVFFI